MENQIGIHMSNNANDFIVTFCISSYFIKCVSLFLQDTFQQSIFVGIVDGKLHQNQFSLKESVWCVKFNRLKEMESDHILKSRNFGNPSR
jgi:hypothetical protein